ncbi:hypothetical protein BCY86_08770 [Pajaroellobacter abortibovis]|uniref:Nucleotidyltransferase n=2 Tax=Pajaroellobacter abortibovis TaxID=1882918 RepID=A0A1L6MYU8_9BACT|nr:hypothetical protein BCY86_08770 [Pajaroellobacter abortibovis]
MSSNWIAHHASVHALSLVQKACDTHSIKILPVKGILTSYLLYEDPFKRTLSDVDIRISQSDLGKLLSIASKYGWKILRYCPEYKNIILSIGGIQIDVETTVGPPGVCSLTVEEMLTQAKEHTSPFGFPHLQPEIHQHALLLCMNIFKDKLIYAQKWAIQDVEQIITHKNFDVRKFIHLVKRSHNQTILSIVAKWLSIHHSSKPWTNIYQKLAPRIPRPIYARCIHFLIETHDPFPFALKIGARLASDHPPTRKLALKKLYKFAKKKYLVNLLS